MSSTPMPKSIAEAKAIHEKNMARKKGESEKKAAEQRSNNKAEQTEAKEEYKKQQQHDNHIYSLKPATELVNGIAKALEDPSNDASNLVCDHIAKTGLDNNIYVYGIRCDGGHAWADQFDGIHNFYKTVDTTVKYSWQDMAKDFIRTGTIIRHINHGQFIGYKLVGYGSDPCILRWIMPDQRTFHVYLRKTFWTRLSDWIK